MRRTTDRPRRWRRRARWLGGLLVRTGLVCALLGTSALAGMVYASTRVQYPARAAAGEVTVISYSDGSPLATVGAEHRVEVPLARVPLAVQRAVLAAEDRGFYSEPGVSITGLARATLNDLRGGATQGGSTITQQYVKNAYLTQQRTLSRKFRELVLSIKLDREYSKDQILGWYLNTICFGRGAYGVEAAARTYFGIGADQLSVAQGAVIAAVIKSPVAYDPVDHPVAARARWAFVLDGMVSQGWLSPAARARLQFPAVLPRGAGLFGQNAGPNGVVLAAVRAELAVAGFDDERLRGGGLRVVTTLDHAAQSAAIASIGYVLGDQPAGLRAAALSIHPGTGAVLAYYGGAEPGGTDAVTALRRPAGTLDPFVLAAALSGGVPVDAGLVAATTRGDRAVYRDLARGVGEERLTATSLLFGVPAQPQYEARPLDLAAGYAALAAGGVWRSPYLVAEVRDASGQVLYRHHNTPSRRVLDPAAANDVAYAMHGVAAHAGRALTGNRPSSAAVGDTTGRPAPRQDAWMAGFTPQAATVAWFGTDRPVRVGRPLGAAAARVWQRVTDAALRDRPVLNFAATPLFGRAYRVPRHDQAA
jgi:membrane peptidoglycan carboxypeptidase